MGCSLRKNSQKHNQSHLSVREQVQSNEMSYEELFNPIPNFTFKKWKMFNVQSRVYISFWSEYQQINEFKLLDAQTLQVYSFAGYQGHFFTIDITIQKKKLLILILTDECLYQLQMIDSQLKIVRQLQIMRTNSYQYGQKSLQQYKHLVLMNYKHQVYMIRLGSQNRSKILFKTQFDTEIKSPCHNIQKGVFISDGDQQFIKILDIITKKQKQVQLKCPGNGSNEIKTKYIKLINGQIDVVFNIDGKGLFQNTINYQGQIVNSRFIYSYVSYFEVYEDDGLIALQTENYYIQLDKDYNILQKFEINHNLIYHELNNYPVRGRSSCYCLGNIRKIGLFFILRHGWVGFNFILFKQQKNFSKGIIWLKKVENYQLEFDKASLFQNQVVISQNQQFLALKYKYCLIFYKIKQKVEQQYFFDQQLELIQFSNNSRYLYVQFHDRLICFRCQENLKLSNQWFNIKKHESTLVLASLNLIYQYQNFNTSQLTNKAKKKIFRIKSIKNRITSISREMYMISNFDDIIIYRLADRKQFLKLTIENIYLRLMYNAQDLLLISKYNQLELWNFNSQHASKQGVIIDNIRNIRYIDNRNFNIFELKDEENNTYLFDICDFKILESYSQKNSSKKTLIIYQKPIIISQEYIIYEKENIIIDFCGANIISLEYKKKERL